MYWKTFYLKMLCMKEKITSFLIIQFNCVFCYFLGLLLLIELSAHTNYSMCENKQYWHGYYHLHMFAQQPNIYLLAKIHFRHFSAWLRAELYRGESLYCRILFIWIWTCKWLKFETGFSWLSWNLSRTESHMVINTLSLLHFEECIISCGTHFSYPSHSPTYTTHS